MQPSENMKARAALQMSAPSAKFLTILKPLSTLPLQISVTLSLMPAPVCKRVQAM
jgi:hypothetical protein